MSKPGNDSALFRVHVNLPVCPACRLSCTERPKITKGHITYVDQQVTQLLLRLNIYSQYVWQLDMFRTYRSILRRCCSVCLYVRWLWNNHLTYHIICSTTFFPTKKTRAVYEIMWKNILQPERPQTKNKRRCMCFACWITKAIDTHWEYVTVIAFPRQQWSWEDASMLRLYVHWLSF